MTASRRIDRLRSVVPRWRSFLNTPTVETVPLSKFKDHPPIVGEMFKDLIVGWRRNGQAHDYIDIMDAGIAVGDRRLASEGARKLLSIQKDIQPRIAEQAFQVVEGKSKFVSVSRLPIDEQSVEAIHQKISRLKVALAHSVRNALAHVEIARLYARLGQFTPAEHHIVVAISIAPNDRFVLRAATRFYTMLGQSDDALKRLWSSEAIRQDPWIQSAELAAALLAGRGTKFAHKSGRAIIRNRASGRDLSELATGWVTKMHEDGMPVRAVVKSLQPSLFDPTENALAQGVWLIEHAGREFGQSFPKTQFGSDAHEALAMALEEQGKYREAEEPMKNWFLDQPFQARASISLSHLYFTYLEEYEKALDIAERGLSIHPEEWSLLNSAAISAAMLGKEDLARSYIKRLDRMSSNPEVEIFSLAAKGLVSFQFGKFDDGLRYYMESVRLSKKNGNHSRILLAYIYMNEMMVRHRVVDKQFSDKIISKIKSLSKNLPSESQKQINKVIGARSVVSERLFSSGEGRDLFIGLHAEQVSDELTKLFEP